jgi:hypothetical protein
MERGLTNGATATEVVEALISSSKESSKRSLHHAHRFRGCHVTTRIEDSAPKIVYWHRELPPLKAELVAEHTVEANSSRVRGTIAHRDELWDQCYRELMANAESRLVQEVARLGGHFAHVHDETIDPKHDDAAGEAWLHGRFSYMLYRRPQESR